MPPANGPTRRVATAAAVAVAVAGFAAAAGRGTAQDTPTAPDADAVRLLERNVLVWVSTIVSAQRAYAAANGGLFDEVRCLQLPAECIPSFPRDGVPFLDPTYQWLEPSLGYARRLHLGPRPGSDEIARRRASPTSALTFAFTAAPVERSASKLRGFCGDSSGRMCFTPDGSEPPVKDGRCEPCRKLQ